MSHPAQPAAKSGAQTPPSFERIRASVADDIRAVDALILEELKSDVVLINQIGHHIIGGGGKRLRPLLVLLSARACGYSGQHHLTLAAVIEFIHTATLLHDDVVDASSMRRGQDSANALWGNAASVLSGDFLYSRAFQLMVAVDRMDVQRLLADTTNRIAEGEVMQLLGQNNPQTSREDYFRVVEAKTARLFSAGAELGAIITDSAPAQREALAEYGKQLGLAFQIKDDMLDYESDAERMGKNAGDDLAEGKPTLPVIVARERADDAQRRVLDAAIGEGDIEQLAAVQAILHDTDAMSACAEAMQAATDAAIAAAQKLPASEQREALIELARLACQRDQ